MSLEFLINGFHIFEKSKLPYFVSKIGIFIYLILFKTDGFSGGLLKFNGFLRTLETHANDGPGMETSYKFKPYSPEEKALD